METDKRKSGGPPVLNSIDPLIELDAQWQWKVENCCSLCLICLASTLPLFAATALREEIHFRCPCSGGLKGNTYPFYSQEPTVVRLGNKKSPFPETGPRLATHYHSGAFRPPCGLSPLAPFFNHSNKLQESLVYELLSFLFNSFVAAISS